MESPRSEPLHQPHQKQQQQQQQQHRVRKRAPNACNRCRQQKIRCSGSAPCGQCSKKSLTCSFSGEQRKVVVTREFLTNLERRAALSACKGSRSSDGQQISPIHPAVDNFDTLVTDRLDDTLGNSPGPINAASRSNICTPSDSDPDSRRVSNATDPRLINPLVSGKSTYTADSSGKPSYLGTSSNWSFGRRILSTAHERVYGSSLPPESLLFEGSTYDLGWDGRRTSNDFDNTALPTADFALFLINAVKFHAGQLFHLFDEHDFMQNFTNYHESSNTRHACSALWYVHYLLILALGKAFIVRVGQDKRPAGANLFVQAMNLLPDSILLCKSPIQSSEIFCCAALYLQCLDMREAAYSHIGQAMRMAVTHGIHTDIQSHHYTEAMTERCREVWWTVYVLDCQMSSLMGTPLALAEQDVSARLPSFSGSLQKSLALGIHVKLAKITTLILRTVYGEDGRMDNRFVASIKNALKSLASVNNERNSGFRLDLKTSSSSISRLSAYLHLFHHQCIILTTRPLLYAFWQRRVESLAPMRVTSLGGVRSLLRVCVASALETLKILAALQAQSLLESFIPFDLESTWSSALVLLVTNVVDPSLIREKGPWIQTTHSILDEMIARGNLVAGFRKSELQQLEETLKKLPATSNEPAILGNTAIGRVDSHQQSIDSVTQVGSVQSQMSFEPLRDWNSDEGLSGEQLSAVADLLDFTDLDWSSAGLLGQLDASMYS